MLNYARALLVAPFMVIACATTNAAELVPGQYALDKTHASLTWKVNHFGMSYYTARFERMDATLKLDTQDPTKSSISVTVDTDSVHTGYPNPEKVDFDKEIALGSDWLDGKNHPKITFTSTKVERTGETTAKVTGDMTIRGVTKPVVLDVVLNGGFASHPLQKVPAIGFSAKGSIKRSDFGVTKFIPAVGDTVEFTIEAEFLQRS